MKAPEIILIVLLCAGAGALGGMYAVKGQQTEAKFVVLDIDKWSSDLVDLAAEKRFSAAEMEVEKRILSRDVNTKLKSLKEQGVMVLDARSVLASPETKYVNRYE